MPVINANSASVILLARSVDTARRYIDLMEVRTDPVRFLLYNPTGEGEILGKLSQDEALQRLASWPIRVPRHDEARLPYGDLTENGRAWLGWPDGMP